MQNLSFHLKWCAGSTVSVLFMYIQHDYMPKSGFSADNPTLMIPARPTASQKNLVIEPKSSGMCFTSSPILCSMEKQGQRSLRNNISLPATHHVPPRARSAPPSRGHGQMAQNMDRSDFDGIGFLFEACLSPITLNLHERLWQKSMPFGVSSLSFSPVRPNVVLSPLPEMRVYTRKHH